MLCKKCGRKVVLDERSQVLLSAFVGAGAEFNSMTVKCACGYRNFVRKEDLK